MGSHFRSISRWRDRARADTAVCPYGWCIAVFLFMLSSLNGIAAQAATPPATPDVPPAEICLVAAPSFEALNAIVNAAAIGGTPVVTRTPGVVPDGTPADPGLAAAITETIRELVGCYNAGELLRSYGLYTDAYLNRLFNRQGGFSRSVYDSFATPEPTADPSTRTAILEIKDIRVFDDGSAGATVTMRYASIPMPKTFFMSFEKIEDRWLISGILGEISFSLP